MNSKKEYFDLKHIIDFINGDEKAFEIIYLYYNKHIYYMGMQMFHNDEERSKDLVQSTFSEVYRSIKKLKAPQAFYIWMNQIAYRQGCKMLRYQSKDASFYTSKDEENMEYVNDGKQVDIVTKIQRKEAVNIILKTLNDMDENKRLIGYLRYFEELSIKEISEITKINENTVMSHLHRIKNQLKRTLELSGFTSASCLSVLLVPDLVSYFHTFIENINITPLLNPGNLSKTIKSGKAVKSTKILQSSTHWVSATKIVACLAIATPITTIGVADKVRPNQNIPIEEKTGEIATFTQIDYEKEIVNHPLKINIETSNHNYDKILLNNKTNMVIDENGKYVLSLIKDDKVIDNREIVISNIDMDIPEVIKEDIQDEYIVFEIMDNLSGIDYEHIEFLENNEIVDTCQVDASNGRITIPKTLDKNGHLKIPDKVGNVLNIKINSYKKVE